MSSVPLNLQILKASQLKKLDSVAPSIAHPPPLLTPPLFTVGGLAKFHSHFMGARQYVRVVRKHILCPWENFPGSSQKTSECQGAKDSSDRIHAKT